MDMHDLVYRIEVIIRLQLFTLKIAVFSPITSHKPYSRKEMTFVTSKYKICNRKTLLKLLKIDIGYLMSPSSEISTF